MNGAGDILFLILGFVFGGVLIAFIGLLALLLFAARSLQTTVKEFNHITKLLREDVMDAKKGIEVLSNPAFSNAADTFVRMAAFWPTAGRLIQQLTDQVQNLSKGLFREVPEEVRPTSVAATEQAKVMSRFWPGATDEEQARREAEAEARAEGIEVNDSMVPPPPPILRVVDEA